MLSLLVLSAKLSGGQLGSAVVFWAQPGLFSTSAPVSFRLLLRKVTTFSHEPTEVTVVSWLGHKVTVTSTPRTINTTGDIAAELQGLWQGEKCVVNQPKVDLTAFRLVTELKFLLLWKYGDSKSVFFSISIDRFIHICFCSVDLGLVWRGDISSQDLGQGG